MHRKMKESTLWQGNLPNVMCLLLTWAYGNRYPKQLKHLLSYSRIDHVSTFYAGRCSFVSWVLTQLWRPPVLSKTIAMARTKTQFFNLFVWQMFEASPLQNDLVLFEVCTRQKTFFLVCSYIISAFIQKSGFSKCFEVGGQLWKSRRLW